MEGLIEGRMCHYVMTGEEPGVLGHTKGDHRAAVVVRVFDGGGWDEKANLHVFVDGLNDMVSKSQEGPVLYGGLWRTSVPYDQTKSPGTWHWIERA